jgi:hypothetical protein
MGPRNANNGDMFAALAGVFVCIGIFFVILLIVLCFFLATLQKTQREVSPRNRSIEPGMVWLILIPIFNIVWMFVVVIKLAESLRAEYKSRGLSYRNESFGYSAGMVWCVCNIAQSAVSFLANVAQAPALSLISLLISLTGLVCWIVYWVQMAGYGRVLREGGRGRDYDDDEESSYIARRRRHRGDEDFVDDDYDDEDDRGYNRRSRGDEDQSQRRRPRRPQRDDDEEYE